MIDNKKGGDMKIAVFILSVIIAFITGYFAGNYGNTALTGEKKRQSNSKPDKRVTSIGGVFFKSENPQKLKEWYSRHLGLGIDEYGTNFVWRQADAKNKEGYTQWSPFNASTDYFEPSSKDFMINYRVQNLTRLVQTLKEEGVTVLDSIVEFEYGNFSHIMDPEGNKIELWEPNDEEYKKLLDGITK